MLLSDNVCQIPSVGGGHHVAGLDVPRARRCGEDVVGTVGDQLAHRALHPLAALRVGRVVAHDQRNLLGGQRAAHLEIGHHLEVVCAAEQVQCGQPVFGVRPAGQGDGPGGRHVAVGAVDHRRVDEVADAAVPGGDREVFLDLQDGGPHRQRRDPHVFGQGTGAGIVLRVEHAELLARGAQDRDVLAPGERGRGQRDAQQHHHRAQRHRRPAQPRRPGNGGRRRAGRSLCAIPQRVLDVPGGQIRQHAGRQQYRRAFDEAGVPVAGVGQPEDEQRPMPQVQRVGHRAQRHQRPGRQ